MRVLEWKRRALLVVAALSSTVVCFWVSLLDLQPEGPVTGPVEPDHPPQPPGHRGAAPSRDSTEHETRLHDDADFLPYPVQIPRLAEYCNIPDRVVAGEEGDAPREYILRSVYVIIVHGGSTPMASFPDLEPSSQNCTMNKEFLRHIPHLRHFLSDMAAQSSGQPAGSEFSHWALFPQHKQCGTLQLTGQGALQHLLTGLTLKDKYVHKQNLFGNAFSSSQHLHLRSTQVSRTYQSTIALLYAFLPHFNITQLDLRVAQDALFCDEFVVPLDCCRSLHWLKQKMEGEHSKPGKKYVRSEESPVVEALADVLDVRKDQLPPLRVLADFFQSYVCHGLALPCSSHGKCVTAAMLKELFKLMDKTAYRDSKDVRLDCYSRILTHPLFLDILTSMTRVSRSESPVKFTLYSGHDLTLTSVLQALGVPEGRQLRRAARVVMELYSRGEKGSHHVRVLRDGKDVTSHVRFCRGRTVHGLCRLKDFETFVTRDNTALLGATDPARGRRLLPPAKPVEKIVRKTHRL